MSPATIAIIPLVLVVVVTYVLWFWLCRKDGCDKVQSTWLAVFCTGVSFLVAWGLVYCVGVVYFDSWSF